MASTIQGMVSLEGAPLGGAYIRLVGPSGEFVSEQYTKDDGRFTFYVAPGTWTLEARAPGAETAVKQVQASEGDTPVAVDLKPGG